MKFDRIVNDLLSFINSLLWWREGEVSEPPYRVIGTGTRGSLGMLYRIEKRRLPNTVNRSIDSWLFLPYRHGKAKQEVKDIHVDCAFLGAIDKGQHLAKRAKPTLNKQSRGRRATDPTYRIEILEASHWVDKDGKWESDTVFSGDFDLHGSHPSPRFDGYAKAILADVAIKMLHFRCRSINWETEIEISRKHRMREHYTPSRKIENAPTHLNPKEILIEGARHRKQP